MMVQANFAEQPTVDTQYPVTKYGVLFDKKAEKPIPYNCRPFFHKAIHT